MKGITVPTVSDNRGLYYEAHGPAPVNAARLLLISYHFPPDPAVGGLRWQQMTRHLAEQGWSADVISRDFTTVRGIDRARLDALPPGTRIFSVRDSEPFLGRLHKLTSPLVKRLLVLGGRSHAVGPTQAADGATGAAPTAGRRPALVRAYFTCLALAREASWARAAGEKAIALTRTTRYAVVISSGPPHMAHVAARMTASEAKLPLIVDMRDPWSLFKRLHPHMAGRVWVFLTRRHERRVVESAALVVMNTEVSRQSMAECYPELAERLVVVRNGADHEQIPVVEPDDVFRIRFAGSIYLDRDPRLVFRAAAHVIRQLSLSPRSIQIEFIGHVESYAGVSVLEMARQEGVEGYVSVGELRPRKEALRFLAGATMLLSLPQDSDFAIPAKIYEYTQIDAWMLVLASRNSATAQLLKDSDACVVDPADLDGLVAAIRDKFTAFSNGVRPQAVGRDGRFDRRAQSEKLLALLKKITGIGSR